MNDVRYEVEHESVGGRIVGRYVGNNASIAKEVYDLLVKKTNENVSRLINYVVIEERLAEDIERD